MGIYIGKDTYLEIICAILLSRTDSVNYSETKIGIVDCILKNNETWIKLITCYTIDPVGIVQAKKMSETAFL